MTVIREPAVAGQFYPGSASELGTTIRVLFDEVEVAEACHEQGIMKHTPP